jgi:hypothetical protein
MHADRERAVRAAFAAQAEWCRKLGSPFTARLCEVIGPRLDHSTRLGRRVLDWPGEPDALHDSVPLRLAGGFHALVRRGRLPDLAALYPPHDVPDPDDLWPALQAAISEAEADLLPWLDLPPQTNEVARSAVLMAGLAVVAEETGLPLSLHEVGASAGLNLLFDRYGHTLGSRVYGDPTSALVLEPDWEGGDPPDAVPQIAHRRGVDRNPLDVTDAADRERLLAYIWPDQTERLERLEAALAIAQGDPPSLDQDDAADWLESEFERSPVRGECRVLLHSIAFQYFPPETQARIVSWMEAAGASAERDAPVAWLRYEHDPEEDGRPTLRLRLWPDGLDRVLANPDAHGRRVRWLA